MIQRCCILQALAWFWLGLHGGHGGASPRVQARVAGVEDETLRLSTEWQRDPKSHSTSSKMPPSEDF